MGEQRPVQTSAVYLLGANQFPAVPPPSPPSPPDASELCTPIDALDLGEGSHVSGGPVTLCDDRLAGAVHVLATEATTLQCLARLYSTDPVARAGFSRAVVAVTRHGRSGRGKLVVVGVGKSGHIGRKLVATFNSLDVQASFLHPTEALHGDLGQIGPHDTLLLITFSGRTPELLALLPHLDPSLPLILLTGHTRPDTCELLTMACRRRRRRSSSSNSGNSSKSSNSHSQDGSGETILLPAPVHEAESVCFGVSAPTSSTTAALAVGDALAIVAAQELHGRSAPADGDTRGGVGAIFATNHPGGAIGASTARPTSPLSSSARSPSSTPTSPSPPPSPIPPSSGKRPENITCGNSGGSSRRRCRDYHHRTREVRHLAVRWCDIPAVVPSGLGGAASATGADVLRAGYASASGWVRLALPLPPPPRVVVDDDGVDDDADVVIPPSRIRRLGPGDMDRAVGEMQGLAVRRADFVAVAADTSVRRAAEWVGGPGGLARAAGDRDGSGLPDADGEGVCGPGVVIGVVEGGECIGVLELETLLSSKRVGGRGSLV